jgi:hypothetical protein
MSTLMSADPEPHALMAVPGENGEMSVRLFVFCLSVLLLFRVRI